MKTIRTRSILKTESLSLLSAKRNNLVFSLAGHYIIQTNFIIIYELVFNKISLINYLHNKRAGCGLGDSMDG